MNTYWISHALQTAGQLVGRLRPIEFAILVILVVFFGSIFLPSKYYHRATTRCNQFIELIKALRRHPKEKQ